MARVRPVPSHGARLARSHQPPLGIARQYRTLVWGLLDRFEEQILAIALEGWDTNPAHNATATVPRRTDALASSYVTKRIGAIKLVTAEIVKPGSQASKDIRILAARVGAHGALEFQRVVGIKTSESGLGNTIDTFRDRNVGLITSLAGTQVDEVTDLLAEAEAGAWLSDTLRAKIQERFAVSKSKADLLARDQILKLNGQVTQTLNENAGITEYIWTTSRDERVRPDHEALDGTRQAWAVPPVVDEASGRTANPGGDYQCRCTPFPLLPGQDDA